MLRRQAVADDDDTPQLASRRRLAVLLGALALLAPAAAHAGVRIANVDASSLPAIRVTVVTSSPSVRPPVVTEDGVAVAGVSAQNLGRAKNVVLAIDHSQSMHGRSLTDALAAARRFVALKPNPDKISIVSFASSTIVESGFSASTDDAATALQSIRVDRQYGTTLYDAIVQSAHELKRGDAPGRVIVLVTDGQETTSKATLLQAIRAARAAHASVYPVAIESATFSPAPLRELAQKTGGAFYRARSSHDLNAIYARISDELRRTWRVEYLTTARPGDLLHLHVTVSHLGTATAAGRVSGSERTPTSSSSARLLLIAALAFATLIVAVVAGPLLAGARLRIRWRGADDSF